MGLLNQSATNDTIKPLQEYQDNSNEISISNEPPEIIFFDLETTGFGSTAGILQMAAGCNGSYFNKYVTPTTAINSKASEVHGLTSSCGELFYHSKRVETLPLDCVMREFHTFLRSFGKPCLLVARNCNFDKPRLINAMADTGTIPTFQKCIIGFSDTLPIFRSLLNRHTQTSQVDLAKEFLTDVSTDEAHNAIEDVQILEKLVKYFKISDDTFIEKKQSIQAFLLDQDKKKRNARLRATTLGPLHKVISKNICDKLIEASITYDKFIDVFIAKGEPGVIAL
ncbi:DNA polymerase III subunit epsilon-like [Neodiprion pinetum]|uniref:DNA polymerase III subunit epsilon-like n=1 Tax=Neodiprion pinetum TaxID=441929 RepID=UPI0037241D79